MAKARTTRAYCTTSCGQEGQGNHAQCITLVLGNCSPSPRDTNKDLYERTSGSQPLRRKLLSIGSDITVWWYSSPQPMSQMALQLLVTQGLKEGPQ